MNGCTKLNVTACLSPKLTFKFPINLLCMNIAPFYPSSLLVISVIRSADKIEAGRNKANLAVFFKEGS